MEKLQVLVAAMGQKDLSLTETMNIRCGAIIANQADRAEVVCAGNVKMITTATRGVGRNRNIALEAAEGEYLLFADDDMVYYDGMAQAVEAAFAENPRADVLIFGIDILRGGEISEKRHFSDVRKLHVWNSMRYGCVRIGIRREALLRAGIAFNENFGGGCPFSAGEDSLFLKACFDAGLRVYTHPCVLGTCCKDTSTWFVGYNEKYFYDKGVLVRHLFPKTAYLMAPYFAIRFKRETNVAAGKRLKLVYAGVRGGKNLIPYGRNA